MGSSIGGGEFGVPAAQDEGDWRGARRRAEKPGGGQASAEGLENRPVRHPWRGKGNGRQRGGPPDMQAKHSFPTQYDDRTKNFTIFGESMDFFRIFAKKIYPPNKTHSL